MHYSNKENRYKQIRTRKGEKTITENIILCVSTYDKLLMKAVNVFFPTILSGIPSEMNSLDPDQARHIVRPDLGPICLQRLSADNTSRQN